MKSTAVDDVNPTAEADTFTTDEDTALSGTVSGNDSVGVDAPATWSTLTDPSNGTLVFNADGTFTYTPHVNFNGTDSFTYEVTDSDGQTASAGVVIHVTPVSDAPEGADTTITMLEDGTYTLTTADFGFSDPNDSPSNTFTFVVITQLPMQGSLQLNGVDVTLNQVINRLDIDAGRLTFAPDPEVSGNAWASFQYQVIDDGNVSAGSLDPTFDFDGITGVGVWGFVPSAYNDVTIQADGKIVGVTWYVGTYPYDFGILRYNSDGSLDKSFDGDGIATLNILRDDTVTCVAVQSDGKIVVGGYSEKDFAIVRYNSDGSLDTSFGGGDGIVTTDLGGTDCGRSVAIQSDGKIVLAGHSDVHGDNDLVVVRYNQNGSLDTSFGGGDGIVITSLDGGDYINSVALQPDGKIVAAGYTEGKIFVIRYDMDGSFDTSFGGGDGIVTTSVTGNDDGSSVALRSDGKIVVAGRVGDDFAVVCYTADGSLDTSFGGGDGIVTTDIDGQDVGKSVAVQPDDKIVVVGTTDHATALVRYTADGSLDTSFGGGDGIVTTDFSPLESGNSVALQSDGKIVVWAKTYWNFAVARYYGESLFGEDTDQTPNTITFDVAPVNEAPQGADNTITILEDETYALTVADFGFTDPSDTPPNEFASVTITHLPTAGSLQLDGVEVMLGQMVSEADLDAGRLTFTPAADANGTGYSGFQFVVKDDGGTLYGGQDTDQTPNTITFDVTAVDDVDPTAGQDAFTTNEDTAVSGTVAGNDWVGVDNPPAWSLDAGPTNGTLVFNADGAFTYTPKADFTGTDSFTYTLTDSDDESATASVTITVNSVNDAPDGADKFIIMQADATYTLTAADFVFRDSHDSPANGLESVTITQLPTLGSLQFEGVAVTPNQVISGADIDAGKLTFTPDAGTEGIDYAGFQFVVTDDGGTLHGGQNTDQTPNTITFDVLAPNHAPEGTDNTITMLEDGTYTLTATDFGFSDPHDSPANAFIAVTITQLPTLGSLAFEGVGVTPNQVILKTDIDAGKLTFTPDPDANGTAWDTFYFTVIDDGKASEGSLDVHFSDDGMVTTRIASHSFGNSVAIQSDGRIVVAGISQSQFCVLGYNVDGSLDSSFDGDGILITVLANDSANSVALQSDGKIVVAGTSNQMGNLKFSLLRYDVFGSLDSSLDGDGILTTDVGNDSGNSVALQSDGKIVVAGTSSDDFCVLRYNADGSLDSSLDGDGILTTDVGIDRGNSVALQSDGKIVVAGTSDDDFCVLRYNADGSLDSSFGGGDGIVTVDLGGIDRGNSLALQSDGKIVVAGTSDDDFCVLRYNADGSLDSSFGGGDGIVTVDLGGIDRGNSLALQSDGKIVVAGTTDIGGSEDFAVVRYTVNGSLDWSFGGGDGIVTVDLGGNDSGNSVAIQSDGKIVVAGTAVGAYRDFALVRLNGMDPVSEDTDQTPNAITFDVTSVNDAPEGTDKTITMPEDGTYVLTVGDFGFTDPHDSPANEFAFVTITQLPTSGSLQLDHVEVTLNQLISSADIDAGSLTFTPTADAAGTAWDNFEFAVMDNGGTANGGEDTDQTPNRITFDVYGVDDSDPTAGADTFSTYEDTAVSGTVLGNDSVGVDIPATCSLATGPGNGTLVFNADGTFTYSPDSDFHGTDGFTYTLMDSDGETASATVTITVYSVNDAPEGTDNTVTMPEDGTHILTAADFGFTDPHDNPDNTWVSVTITQLPTAGSLKLDGVDVALDQVISSADIDAGKLIFTPAADGNGTDYSNFRFAVTDDGGTADGGEDTDQTPNTITFDVTAIDDDDPIAGADAFTTNEDTAMSGTVAGNDWVGVDNPPTWSLDAGPANGTLVFNADGTFTYTPDADFNGTDSFTYTLADSDDESATALVTITVNSVNDVPAGADKLIIIDADSAYALTTADFGFSDPHDSPANALEFVTITQLPTAGSFELDGVEVTLNQVISSADIDAGRLTFKPDVGTEGLNYASFRFAVTDDGGTASGGEDTDQTPNTITFDVFMPGHEPEGADKTITMLEDGSYTLTAADFGFSDPYDSPANAFIAVTIAQLPTSGSLKLDGVDVTLDQVIFKADIDAGKLVFTPDAGASGTAWDNFRFAVIDDGKAFAGTLDVRFSGDGVAMTGISYDDMGSCLAIQSDGKIVMAGSAGSFSYRDLALVRYNTDGGLDYSFGGGDGSVTTDLGGTEVCKSVTIQSDGKILALGTSNSNFWLVRYTADGSLDTSFGGGDGIVYTDLGGDDSGNSLVIQSDGKILVTGSSDNNIVVVRYTSDGSLDTSFGGGDGIVTTDLGGSDNGNSAAIQPDGKIVVAGTSSYHFCLVRYTSDGSLDTSFGGGDGIDVGYGGTGNSVAIQSDGKIVVGGTTNGNVSVVRYKADGSIDTSFGGGDGIVDSDAGGSDYGNSVAIQSDGKIVVAGYTSTGWYQDIVVVRYTADGSLDLRFGDGDGVSKVDLTYHDIGNDVAIQSDGKIVVAGNVENSSTDFVILRLNAMEISGQDTDQTPNTITFDVTSLNDAPEGTDKTITMLEEETYTLTVADFGFSDPADTPGNAFESVTITQLPTEGSLMLDGIAVTLDQVISSADIDQGRLTFAPVANGNGTGYANFFFAVTDDGGTLNGGQDTDQSPNVITFDVTGVDDSDPTAGMDTFTTDEDNALNGTVTGNDSVGMDTPATWSQSSDPTNGTLVFNPDGTFTYTPDADFNGTDSFTYTLTDSDGESASATVTITVTSVNDAPGGMNTIIDVVEDATYTLTAADFGFGDPADSPGNALASVTITQLVTAGSMQLDGVEVTLNQVISSADIGAGKLTFTPAADTNGCGYSNFRFAVTDDGGTAYGGEDTDQTPNTIVFDVTTVNDAPEGTDKTITMLEDETYTLTATDFGFSDPADSPANDLFSVTITQLPGTGSLELDGVAVTLDQVISFGDVDAGWLTFAPAANSNGTGCASFLFAVTDDGGTANGGEDTDQTPNTITFDVIAVNDAPEGTDNTITVLEDGTHILTVADFGFNDPNDSPANARVSVTVTGLPAAGSLQFDGFEVALNQVISFGDIDAGKLIFTPESDVSGAGYANFQFAVTDDGGTAYGGEDTDQTPNTITFDVTAVDEDDPTAGADAFTTDEDTAVSGSVAGNDSVGDDNPPTWSQGAGPSDGTLVFNTDGTFTYTPDADFNGTDGFTYTLTDSDGESATATVTITVTPVNDAPKGTDNTIIVLEDGARTLTAADFGFSDPGDSPSDTWVSVTITQLPAAGRFRLDGSDVTLNQVISKADIDAGNLTFTPAADASGTGYAVFQFAVTDDGGTSNGGVDTDPTPNTITFDVTGVNDAPEGTDNTVTMLEDGIYTLTPADFGFSDPDDSPANGLASVTITQLPASGHLLLDGVAVSLNQVISFGNIAAGNLTFTPDADANGDGYSTFQFAVTDDGGTSNGGEDTDQIPNTITFDVTPVNDPPVLTDLGSTQTYTGNGGAMVIDGTITLTDVDSAYMVSATIQITGKYQDGEDVLNIDSDYLPASVTAFWDASTGTLTLSGPASRAEYESMLEHVTYANSSDSPDYGNRSVTWKVNDGEVDSVLRTSTIALADSPMLKPVPPEQIDLLLNTFLGNNPFQGTFGPMPDIDSLLSFLSHKDLLPPSLTLPEDWTAEFQELRQHLFNALDSEGSDVRQQAWDDLMLFLDSQNHSGHSVEMLNLKDFLTKLQEWHSGLELNNILLAFNADEIHLADWLSSLAGPNSLEMLAGQTPHARVSEPEQDWLDARALMLNIDDVKIADLILPEARAQCNGAACLATPPAQATAWILEPGGVSFDALLTPLHT